jgi:hypothetical protein
MGLYEELQPKGVYTFLTSPGNVKSGITPNSVHPWLLIFALYVMRLLGCSGINITGHNAATATLDLIDCSFDEMDPYVLYHSEINILGTRSTKILHIERAKELGKQMVGEMDRLLSKYTK